MAYKGKEQITKKEFRKIVDYAVHYHFCYCYLCGKPILPDQKWNLDHIHPRSKGGETRPYNLRPTHYDCNQAKADLTLGEFRRIQELMSNKSKER